MCSYLTVATDVAGSAKGPNGWFSVTSASVYFDHPFHAPFDHTLNIDFADPAGTGRPRRGGAQRGVGAAPGGEQSRRRSMPPASPHRDHPVTTPAGGRRPPPVGPGARSGADLGGGVGGAGAARGRARPRGWVLARGDGHLAVARARRVREGGRLRAQSRLARHAPPRGRDLGCAAGIVPLPPAARDLRRRPLGGAGLRGRRRPPTAPPLGPGGLQPTVGEGPRPPCTTS